MRLLACQETHLQYTDICQNLLERFVESYGNIYDPTDLVYNLHGLYYLLSYVRDNMLPAFVS